MGLGALSDGLASTPPMGWNSWNRFGPFVSDQLVRETADALIESGIREGLILVNAMHISASVFINDDESGLHHDYEEWLERLAPHAPVNQYRHNDTGEDNADAHLRRQIMGREVVVAVTAGRLDFGPWEQIFYGELFRSRAWPGSSTSRALVFDSRS